MIVLANPDFALGLKFSGIDDSHIVRTREEGIALLKDIPKDSFILANVSIIEMVPELKEYPHLVSIPDNAEAFKSIDDLKYIVKSAIGTEIEVV